MAGRPWAAASTTSSQKGKTTEIVGVVGNVLKNGLTDKPQPEFYVVLGNHGALASGRDIYLVIRSTRTPRTWRRRFAQRRATLMPRPRFTAWRICQQRSRRPRAIHASRRRR